MSSSVRFDNSSPIKSPNKDGHVTLGKVGVRRDGIQEEAYQLHTNQTAIKEIIDNSFDALANTVKVNLHKSEKEPMAMDDTAFRRYKKYQPFDQLNIEVQDLFSNNGVLQILDNGVGLSDAETLLDHGSSKHASKSQANKNSIGQYGKGFKNSQCRLGDNYLVLSVRNKRDLEKEMEDEEKKKKNPIEDDIRSICSVHTKNVQQKILIAYGPFEREGIKEEEYLKTTLDLAEMQGERVQAFKYLRRQTEFLYPEENREDRGQMVKALYNSGIFNIKKDTKVGTRELYYHLTAFCVFLAIRNFLEQLKDNMVNNNIQGTSILIWNLTGPQTIKRKLKLAEENVNSSNDLAKIKIKQASVRDYLIKPNKRDHDILIQQMVYDDDKKAYDDEGIDTRKQESLRHDLSFYYGFQCDSTTHQLVDINGQKEDHVWKAWDKKVRMIESQPFPAIYLQNEIVIPNYIRQLCLWHTLVTGQFRPRKNFKVADEVTYINRDLLWECAMLLPGKEIKEQYEGIYLYHKGRFIKKSNELLRATNKADYRDDDQGYIVFADVENIANVNVTKTDFIAECKVRMTKSGGKTDNEAHFPIAFQKVEKILKENGRTYIKRCQNIQKAGLMEEFYKNYQDLKEKWQKSVEGDGRKFQWSTDEISFRGHLMYDQLSDIRKSSNTTDRAHNLAYGVCKTCRKMLPLDIDKIKGFKKGGFWNEDTDKSIMPTIRTIRGLQQIRKNGNELCCQDIKGLTPGKEKLECNRDWYRPYFKEKLVNGKPVRSSKAYPAHVFFLHRLKMAANETWNSEVASVNNKQYFFEFYKENEERFKKFDKEANKKNEINNKNKTSNTHDSGHVTPNSAQNSPNTAKEEFAFENDTRQNSVQQQIMQETLGVSQARQIIHDNQPLLVLHESDSEVVSETQDQTSKAQAKLNRLAISTQDLDNINDDQDDEKYQVNYDKNRKGFNIPIITMKETDNNRPMILACFKPDQNSYENVVFRHFDKILNPTYLKKINFSKTFLIPNTKTKKYDFQLTWGNESKKFTDVKVKFYGSENESLHKTYEDYVHESPFEDLRKLERITHLHLEFHNDQIDEDENTNFIEDIIDGTNDGGLFVNGDNGDNGILEKQGSSFHLIFALANDSLRKSIKNHPLIREHFRTNISKDTMTSILSNFQSDGETIDHTLLRKCCLPICPEKNNTKNTREFRKRKAHDTSFPLSMVEPNIFGQGPKRKKSTRNSGPSLDKEISQENDEAHDSIENGLDRRPRRGLGRKHPVNLEEIPQSEDLNNIPDAFTTEPRKLSKTSKRRMVYNDEEQESPDSKANQHRELIDQYFDRIDEFEEEDKRKIERMIDHLDEKIKEILEK